MTLECRNISAGYDRRPVLRGISLTAGLGDFVGIVGPNGCGKSTLLRVLNGWLAPLEGEAWLDGKPLRQWDRRARARAVATVPQHPMAPASITVRELVGLGRIPHAHWSRPTSPSDRAAVEAALAASELQALADRPVASLSGGERQRAWIAMAIAQDTPFLLLDEPTAALDIGHQLEVMELLKRLNQRLARCIIVVIHDLNLAARYCGRILLMHQGRMEAWGAAPEVLCPEVLAGIFGVGVQTLPLPDAPGGRMLHFTPPKAT